jgi:hypothetical protein
MCTICAPFAPVRTGFSFFPENLSPERDAGICCLLCFQFTVGHGHSEEVMASPHVRSVWAAGRQAADAEAFQAETGVEEVNFADNLGCAPEAPLRAPPRLVFPSRWKWFENCPQN